MALGTQVPRTLQGKVPAIALNNLADFSVGGKGPQTSPISNAFQAMYDESTDAVLQGTGQETFEAVKMLKAADPAKYQPAAGVVYPNTPFGNSLKQIAQLMKANLGVEAAFSDIGGWDTHQNQGAATGQLANRLTEFSKSIAAFWRDMGTDAENVTLVTMSEFGRTARQNGTGGTDHGHANVMFVLGGGGEGRQGLREVAGDRERAAERGAGPGGDDGLPQCAGRGGVQDAGVAGSGDGVSGGAGAAGDVPEFHLDYDSLVTTLGNCRRISGISATFSTGGLAFYSVFGIDSFRQIHFAGL